MKSVCVYCGSKTGANPVFAAAARELGQLLANQQQTLVFGGGSVGLMGVVADSVLQADGTVIGVIPHALSGEELLHPNVSEMFVVEDMHERKAKMAMLADAFITMPGGFGTLEEVFEVLTWAQLGFHRKPIGFLNVDGYYDALLNFLDVAVGEGFVKSQNLDLFVSDSDPQTLLDKMKDHEPPDVKVWTGPS